MRVITFFLAAILFIASPVAAEVTKIEVQTRDDIAGRKSFGLVGSYERLSGKIFFEIDPNLDSCRAFSRQRLKIAFGPRYGDHMSSHCSKCDSAGATDTTSGAGDQDYFVLES